MGGPKQVIPEEMLRDLYVEQQLSSTEIATLCGCSSLTVIHRLREYGIPVRGKAEAGMLVRGVEIPENVLRDLYEQQGMSSIQIASRYGCSDVVVRKKLVQCGIPIRSRAEAASQRWDLNIPEELLRDLYEVQKLSTVAIADKYGCTHRAILLKMAEYGIKTRTISEAMALIEGYPKTDFSGDLQEKSYLIGFRLGDMYARMVQENGHTILVSTTTTKLAQLQLIHDIFHPYGWVDIEGPRSKGHYGIKCYLNMTFDFLLPKVDRIENWIMAEPERYFAPFFAGYLDAEGHFGVSKGRSCLKVSSCDKAILQQSYTALISLGILIPPPILIRPAGTTDNRGVTNRRDVWRLGSGRRASLLQIIALVDPYLKHAKRRRDMELVRSTILAHLSH